MLLLTLVVSPKAKVQKAHPAPIDNGLCYAFLRNGDLWTVCDAKRERIHIDHHAFDLTFSASTSSMAFLIDKPELRGRTGQLRSDLVVVDLGQNARRSKSEVEFRTLVATCGTILGFPVGIGKRPPMDLLTGSPLEFPPNLDFRCTSDRRVVLGFHDWGTPQESQLVLTVDGKESRTFFADLGNPGDFDISSNGRYIAYIGRNKGRESLCVSEPAGPAACSPMTPGGAYQIFVSDLGVVLYTTDSDKDCGGASCRAVAYWRPGLAGPEIIEANDSNSPQWITPQAAAALHRWNTSHPAGVLSQGIVSGRFRPVRRPSA